MKQVWYLGWMLGLVLLLGACGGGKQSAVEGKLVDWAGQPVAGVTITATQVQPIKGYEQFEGKTGADGAFRIKGLFPSSAYVLKPWSDLWSSETAVQVDSAPQGETALLRGPMRIDTAYSKNGGGLVLDLATGKLRFTVSADGVIEDARYGLEWVTGPDQNTTYAQAEQWVADNKVAGGGWRMPTRTELQTLYQDQADVGEGNMHPVFKTAGVSVWAEPRDSSSAWRVNFGVGAASYGMRNFSIGFRVFGVRPRPQR